MNSVDNKVALEVMGNAVDTAQCSSENCDHDHTNEFNSQNDAIIQLSAEKVRAIEYWAMNRQDRRRATKLGIYPKNFDKLYPRSSAVFWAKMGSKISESNS